MKDAEPAPLVPRRKLMYRRMAVALWHFVMDGHLPRTKYVMSEIYRLCRKGGIAFKDL